MGWDVSMNIGVEEVVEVWFLPAKRYGYSPRVLRAFTSVDAAREYVAAEACHFDGDLDLVRVTTRRQLVAACKEIAEGGGK